MAESPEREGESRGRGSPPPRRRSPERSPRREYSPRERSPPPPPRDRSPGPHRCENPGTNVYVSGLAQRTRDVDVERAFSKYGKCACRLVSDPRTQEHRGFAFVNYDYPEDAQDAIQGLNRTELDGRVISVELAKRGRPRTPTPGEYLGKDRGIRERYEASRDRRSDRYDPYARPGNDDRRRSPYRDDRYNRDDRYSGYRDDRYRDRYERRRSPSPRRRSPYRYSPGARY